MMIFKRLFGIIAAVVFKILFISNFIEIYFLKKIFLISAHQNDLEL
jgi:hypothetical protein